TKNVKKKGKLSVMNSLPQKRADEIVEHCRVLLKEIREHPTFQTIHDWNAYVVGIHNYYRGMTHFHDSFHKMGWRISKLFYHTMDKNVKFTKEQSYKNRFQEGIYRTWGTKGYYCFNGCPVIELQWAKWDSDLIGAKRGKVTRENPYHYGEKKQRPGVSVEDIGYLVHTSKPIRNSRFAMFRISKYSSVGGISYLSGLHVPVRDYHCHHIIPLSKGGTHDFKNLCVLSELEHTILHSPNPERLYAMFSHKNRRITALINAL
ncbi:MAG: HNH endonuclease, partial [Bacteroides sp.]|nr:HNH endonuclease [Bacteroides sp.]